MLDGIVIEPLAGEGFDDVAEQDEVDVGVFEVGSGGCGGGGVEGSAEAFGAVGGSEAPGVFEVDVGGRPEVWVRRLRRVIWDLSGVAKAGRYLATGSSKLWILPVSCSCMMAVVVTTTLVSEAMSKRVSTVMGSAGLGVPSRPGSPGSLRLPKACW